MRVTLSTLVLVLVSAAVLGGAVLLESVRPVAEVRGRTMRLPLFGDAATSAGERSLPAQPVRITIERIGEPRLLLEREGSQWVQREPFAHPLLLHTVEELLRTAAQVRVIGRLDGRGVELASLGLDPPRALLRVEDADGTDAVTIEIGARGLAGRAFLRLAGRDDVFVTEAALHELALTGDPRDWRDRRLFHHAGADSSEVSIRSGELFIQLQREGRVWQMLSPSRSRTNEPAIDRLMDEIGRARSAGFLTDQPADLTRFGLAEPSGEIVIHSRRLALGSGGAGSADASGAARDGAGSADPVTEAVTERLLIGARMGASTQDRFGMVEGRPVIIRISESVLRTFFRSPLDFVSMTGAGVVRGDVRSITIRPSDGEALRTVERDLDAWRDASTGEAVNAQEVDRLLNVLTQVQAARLEMAAWPRTIERAIITLSGWSGDPIATVRVARAAAPEGSDAPQPWIMDNGDNVLRIYPPSLELPLIGK